MTLPTGSQPSQAQPGAPAGVGPTEGSAPAAPLLSVVKGQPTAEELAALTAVVLSLGGERPAAARTPSVRHWVRRQQLRLAPSPGPGAWKRSGGQ
ncbi:hypothetical protein QFZ57_003633 [Arthrobacter sp. B1I2]|nr:hypothetical protein [Arthrobacter sp. B1I2]